jgi:DNA-binding SARP family transcriptional activator
MVQEFSLALMGVLQLTLGGVDLTAEISAKGQALLCYLALSRQIHSRQVLAGLLWGDKPEEDARRSLRVDLVAIRRLLPDHLDITRQTLAFNRASPYWLDVEAFEHHLQRAVGADGAVARATLREAVALYRGDFLAGFEVSDSPDFEEWMLMQRERLRQMALQTMDRLVNICIEQENYSDGIDYARRLLALDSWREEAHRQLMWLLTLSGQRTAALIQYEICRDILARELDVEPTEETKALYQRIRGLVEAPRLQPKPLPPLPDILEAETIPFQSPVQVPYFLGRDEEVARFKAGLAQPSQSRIYCLAGMGGVGKTSLAIHLAHALRDDFPDGVLWANSATNDPMVIAENWAQAYGYDFSGLPDIESRALALQGILAEKQALLILDDVTSAARIRPLLPNRGKCIVLLTSRNVDLALALDAQPVYLAELAPEDSYQLLTQIVGANRVTTQETAAVEICRLLQNLPLAVTIAAWYLTSRPRRKLADFAAQLHDETSRLDLELGDRQVRASFAISWQALDEVQRCVFAQLAVFEGRPFSAEALAAVAEMDRYAALDRLDALVTLSLLNEEGERHYRQHPLLADFAYEHLGEAEAPYRRMVHYYLVYATDHQREYVAMRPEWENLSATIYAANRLQMWQTVIDFTTVLREAWFARGRYSEARQAYQWARQAAAALANEQVLADCLYHWGCACIEQSDYTEAQELLVTSLGLYANLNDQAGVAAVQYVLARIATEHSHYDEAENLLAQSRRIREQLGDVPRIAETLYRQAMVTHTRGNYEAARQLAQQALAMQEMENDTLGMIRTLRLLVFVAGEVDDHDLAAACSQRALALAEELQDQGELASALYAMVPVHRLRADFKTAHEYAERSLALFTRMGDRRSQAQVLFQICLTNKAAKDYTAALDASQRSLALFQELGDNLYTAITLTHTGDFLAQLGQSIEAQEKWSVGLRLAETLQHPKLIKYLQERLRG